MFQMQPVGDDIQLLHRYAAARDEAAFAQIVRRYVDLVYSAAARRVGRGPMAEDVTQAVFVVLAKKAKSMRTGTPLSLWLLTTVRYAAANALRIEARRARHEREAARARAAAAACSANPSDVLVWQEVAGKLDDAVLKLPATDRRAVVLRYFEDRPIRDIAQDLNVTESAAKQRLSRAMDKLRKRLERDGVMTTSATLGALITAHAVHAAPAGLVSASLAATTGLAACAAGITIAKGAMTMMTWTNTKIAAAVVAAVTLVGGTTGLISATRAQVQDAQPAAAPAAAKDAKADAAEPVSEIVRNAPPVVVTTVPASGAADVDAATTREIRVTFSKKMQDGNWSFAQTAKETFPQTTGKPHYEPDGRTCVLPVKLEPGKPYLIWLNKAPYDSFSDPAGRKAVPYLLVFETRK